MGIKKRIQTMFTKSLIATTLALSVSAGNPLMLVKKSMNVKDANAECKRMGMKLAHPDKKQNAELANVLKKANVSAAWIGLNDKKKEGSWKWMGVAKGNKFLSWNKGEPNNYNTENCVEMYQSGKWNDLKCATKRPFFCQKTKKAAPKPVAPKSIKKAVKKHSHAHKHSHHHHHAKHHAHANFGDLSFLNSEKAFAAAAAARAKFVAAHMKLAAKRRQETLKYFAARHHKGYTHKLMMKFASELKHRIFLHEKASADHEAAKKNTHHALIARNAAKKALLEATHGHMKAQHELAHAKKVKNVSHKHYHAMKDAAADAHKVLMKAEAEYSHCKGEAKTWWKREFIAKAVLNKASKAHKFAHHHMDDAHHEEKDAKRDLEKTR